MSCHYKPYCGHYAIKKFIHRSKLNNDIVDISKIDMYGGCGCSKGGECICVKKYGRCNCSMQKGGCGCEKLDKNKEGKSVLLIVDVQKDFLPGGRLGSRDVFECDAMINSINELIDSDLFDYYVYTQDIHQPGHHTLASANPENTIFDVVKKDSDSFVVWPDHCVSNDPHKGYMFSEKLVVPFVQTDSTAVSQIHDPNRYSDVKVVQFTSFIHSAPTITDKMKKLMRKSYVITMGCDKGSDSFSAFKDASGKETGLAKFLVSKRVRDVYVCGLTRNGCAWWSAVDATTYIDEDEDKEFNVHFILDATVPGLQSVKLPEYDTTGEAPHQKAVASIGVESVLNDLGKNNVVGNSWVNAFLKPYGIDAVTWNDTIESLSRKRQMIEVLTKKNGDLTVDKDAHVVSQSGGSIFATSKPKVSKNSVALDPRIIDLITNFKVRGDN